MGVQYGEPFILSKAAHLLEKTTARHGALAPPVDLTAMFEDCGIVKCEYLHMVPEGVLHPQPGGFTLYLQDNFRNQAGFSKRHRFTTAHEIAHTFFFDVTTSMPRLRPGIPRGEKLEQLCNFGARELLLPRSLIEQELRARGGFSDLEDAEYLAKRFHVSIEVVLGRLKRCAELCSAELGIIYAGPSASGRTEVRAEFHDASFLALANPPKVGSDFSAWVHSIEPRAASVASGTWETTLRSESIRVRKKEVGRGKSLLEIRRT